VGLDLKRICDSLGHAWQKIGQHHCHGIPAYYAMDMSKVTRGSVAYDDFKCERCGHACSEEVPYSWQQGGALLDE
jgi:hypothetical protein